MIAIVEANTIKYSKSNLITSVIYLRFKSFCFPDDVWYDFSLSVFYDWVYCLSDVMIREVDLDFWEGPYLVKIKKQNEHFFASCCDDKFERKVLHTEELDMKKFLESIYGCLNIIRNSDNVAGFQKEVDLKIEKIILMLDKNMAAIAGAV